MVGNSDYKGQNLMLDTKKDKTKTNKKRAYIGRALVFHSPCFN